MKTRIIVIALAAIISLNIGFGKEPEKKFVTKEQQIEYAKKNILYGLRTGNEGIIEGAMMLLARIKLSDPLVETSELQKVMDSLSITHTSDAVRYKAYLVSALCADPEWFAKEKRVVNADSETFYSAVSQRLQYKLFGISSL